jgi:hypothetical protein
MDLNFRGNMKNVKAEAAIKMRLKYDWVVLIFGFLCVLNQLICKGDLGYFLLLVGIFVIVEGLGVSGYRKLLKGKEAYHGLTRRILDERTGFGFILLCMLFEFAILVAMSLIYLANTFGNCLK